MDGFKIHTRATAPFESKPVLAEIEKARGFVPNLAGQLAESPAALQAYVGIARAMQHSRLTPGERELVLLAAAAENACHWCAPFHTWNAADKELPEGAVDAVRADRPVDDRRLEALRRLTVALVRRRGWASDQEVQVFLDAGFGRAEALDVVALVAMKTLSTYANHLAETPLDDVLRPHAFTPVDRTALAAA